MVSIINPVRWLAQPDDIGQIDLANPLASDLNAFIVFRGGHAIDLVRQRMNRTTFGTAPTWGAGPGGKGIVSSGGGATYTSAGAELTPQNYTHISVLQLSAIDSNFGGIWSASNSAGSDQSTGVQRNGTNATLVAFHTASSDSGFVFGAVSDVADNRIHAFAMESANSATRTVYLDGRQYATGAGSIAPPSISTGRIVFFGARTADAAFGSDGVYYAHLVFGRAKGAAAIQELTRNPWQILQPRRRRTTLFLPAGGSTYTLTADAGSYSLTGVAAGLRAARKIAAAQGSYTLTGVAATLTYTPVGGSTYTLAAGAGSYALTGVAAGLKAARKITAAQGTYSLTGVAAGLKAGRKIAAAAGAYTLSGKAAGFRRTYVMPAAVGSYTLTGINATLTYSNPQIWTEVSPASGTWTPVSPAGGTWTPV